ncbi:MAG: 2Fe-2S iron-sulfur cluster-binding protein [Caulobacteraceae bacterium]
MSAGAHRLPAGGLVDRSRPLGFRFDGRLYQGFAGDTLASALMANGVRLVGRSFKYHRPRGIFAAGPEEPNALVELRTGARREPNTKATTVELYDGLEAPARTAGRPWPWTPCRSWAWPRRRCRRASTTRPSCGRRPSGRRSTSR